MNAVWFVVALDARDGNLAADRITEEGSQPANGFWQLCGLGRCLRPERGRAPSLLFVVCLRFRLIAIVLVVEKDWPWLSKVL